MFNLGFSEFIAIAVIALIFIGPKQLPEVARVVGRLLGELKKASQDLGGGLLEVKREVQSTIDETRDEIMSEAQKMKESITNFDDQHDQQNEDFIEDEHHLTHKEESEDPYHHLDQKPKPPLDESLPQKTELKKEPSPVADKIEQDNSGKQNGE